MRSALELHPPQGSPPTIIQDVRALAQEYPGACMLRIVVSARQWSQARAGWRQARRVLTLGEEVDGQDPDLLSALRRYGDVVLVDEQGVTLEFWRFAGAS